MGPVGSVAREIRIDPEMSVGEGVGLWEGVAHIDGELGVVAEGGEDWGIGGEEMAEGEIGEGWVRDGEDGLAVVPGWVRDYVEVGVWVCGCFFGAEVEARCFLGSSSRGERWMSG